MARPVGDAAWPRPLLTPEAREVFDVLSTNSIRDVIANATRAASIPFDPRELRLARPHGKSPEILFSRAEWATLEQTACTIISGQHVYRTLPLIMGGIYFIIDKHGRAVLPLLQQAAPFLAAPKSNIRRLKMMFTLGRGSGDAVWAMQPFVDYCLRFNLALAPMPALFEHLSSSSLSLSESRIMVQRLHRADAYAHELGPTTLGVWLQTACLLPASVNDMAWIDFAARPLLMALAEQERSTPDLTMDWRAPPPAYQETTQSRDPKADYVRTVVGMLKILTFAAPERCALITLPMALSPGPQPDPDLADMLLTLSCADIQTRRLALDVLQRDKQPVSLAHKLGHKARAATIAAQVAIALQRQEPS